MSCPKTQFLLTEYFDAGLPPRTRAEIERHVAECADCHAELQQLEGIERTLMRWQDEAVPHWDRSRVRPTGLPGRTAGLFAWWQWVPTAASAAMLCLVLLNVSFEHLNGGWSIRFGAGSESVAVRDLEQRLNDFAASLAVQQQDELAAFAAQVDARHALDHERLIEAVLDQSQQFNNESLDRLVAYFEAQRQADLAQLQVGYQQLADNDFETIQTVYQLADLVRVQGGLRPAGQP